MFDEILEIIEPTLERVVLESRDNSEQLDLLQVEQKELKSKLLS